MADTLLKASIAFHTTEELRVAISRGGSDNERAYVGVDHLLGEDVPL